MTRIFFSRLGPALALLMSGCAAPPPPDTARADFSADLVRRASDVPPEGPSDACWANDETPAVIETVTEQVLVTPQTKDADGRVTQAAVFATNVDQRMVQDREVVWFQTPCPNQMDEGFVATLQRALKARGYYLQDLSGQMDAPTRTAVRRFQAEGGLDSETLSLAAARELGLIAATRASLQGR